MTLETFAAGSALAALLGWVKFPFNWRKSNAR